MILNNLDCPLSFTARQCCRAIMAAFRHHPARTLVPRTTTDRTLARVTLAITIFPQSQRYPSMGRCDQKIQYFRPLSPSRINTRLAPRISSRFPTHPTELLLDNFQMANSLVDRGRGHRPQAQGGAAGLITLPKSWRVTSAEPARPAATVNILLVVLAPEGLWHAAMSMTLHWESDLDPLALERERAWEILLTSDLT
jgi:hypothetical protein